MTRTTRTLYWLPLLLAGIVTAKLAWPTSAAAASPPSGESAALATALIRVGLDSASLACAGLNGAGATSVVTAVKSHLNSNPTAISSADSSYGDARKSHDELQRGVQSGTATAEQLTAYQSAITTLATATVARQSALDDAFSSGTANLTEAQRTALTTMRANRSWELPTEYLAATLSQADWVKLRDALANKKISEKYSEPASATCTQYLATVDATSAVANAKTNLSTNKAAVASAWNSAVEG